MNINQTPEVAQTDISANETGASEISCDQAPRGLSISRRWVRIAVGLLLLAVLVYLSYPTLRLWLLAPSQGPVEEVATPYQTALSHYEAGEFAEAWAALRQVPEYTAAVQAAPEIEQAEQAVQAAPTSSEAHFKLGAAWARANLLPLAEAAFRKAIALDAQNVNARVNLGVTLYQMGRLEEALKEYDAALAIAPNDADIHYNKGTVYVQQALLHQPPDEQLLDKGLAEFQRALELNPQLPQAYFSSGVVYDLRGQRQEALDMFKRFQELDDGSDPQATTLAQQYIERLSQNP